jgi:ABC-type multidrug transport system fused ATPase/permease subunit
VLERGRIVEDGAPTELLHRDGLYTRMYRRQLAAARRV